MVLEWDPFQPSSRGAYWWAYENESRIMRQGPEEFKNNENRVCQKINSMSRSDFFKYVANVTTETTVWQGWRTFRNVFVSVQQLGALFYQVG